MNMEKSVALLLAKGRIRDKKIKKAHTQKKKINKINK